MRRGTKSGRPVGLVFAALLVLAAGGCRDDAREGNIQKNLPRPGGGVNAIFVRHETWDHIYYEVFMREKDGSDELVFGSQVRSKVRPTSSGRSRHPADPDEVWRY